MTENRGVECITRTDHLTRYYIKITLEAKIGNEIHRNDNNNQQQQKLITKKIHIVKGSDLCSSEGVSNAFAIIFSRILLYQDKLHHAQCVWLIVIDSE